MNTMHHTNWNIQVHLLSTVVTVYLRNRSFDRHRKLPKICKFFSCQRYLVGEENYKTFQYYNKILIAARLVYD